MKKSAETPGRGWAWTDAPLYILAIILLIPLFVHLVEIVVSHFENL